MATLPILAEELIEEILLRVPALNLKRLRFVCKQWNALFNDRRFNEQHFIKAKQQFLMMKLTGNQVNQINLDLDGIHPTLKSSGTLSLNDNVQVNDIFHCHGLLLCTTRDFRLFIWNPCLEQIRWIEDRDNKYTLSDCYSLGYDKKKKMYKILRFPHINFDNRPIDFKIFDLNTNSWRILDNVDFPNCMVRSCGISLKGNCYWAAKRVFGMETSRRFIILSFDFTTERFRGLRCPPSFDYCMVLSNIRDERLSVSMQSDLGICEFWMSSKFDDEKVMCWSKLFNMDFNGDAFCFVTSFLVDEEKKLAVFSNKYNGKGFGIICVGRDGLETVEVDKCSKESWKHQPFLLSFAPSLVRIVH